MTAATLQALLGAAAFALVLGAVGPALEPEDPTPPQPTAAELQAGELARLEAEAHHRCAALGGQNAGYIRTGDGHILCTDKRGRQLRQPGPIRSTP